jgi:hypothetical protein
MTIRNTLISIFVIIWLVVFNYESTRHFYLEPWLGRPLPKLKFLFPPAGWIMFYNVGENYGYAQVYGVKNGQPQMIDPHQILQTRAIGYDNIHRNALVSVLSRGVEKPFCDYLHRKFPYFESFMVTYINHPSVTQRPFEQSQTLAYECR